MLRNIFPSENSQNYEVAFEKFTQPFGALQKQVRWLYRGIDSKMYKKESL